MSNSFQLLKDEYWSATGGGKMLIYNGPHIKDNIDLKDVKKMVRKKQAIGAMWSYDYDRKEESPWYQYICDIKDYSVEKIKSKKGRYYVRRALKSCQVREIEYEYLVKHGYKTYINASTRYSNFIPKSEENFAEDLRGACIERNGIPYGVFCGESLIAYAMVYFKYGGIIVATAFFDPAYSDEFPMYALYYTLTHNYLQRDDCNEVNNGARPLLHETNIGDFLLRLGWRKAYCRLGIYLPFYIKLILISARYLRPAWKSVLPPKHRSIIDSLLQAQQMAKVTGKV